MIDFKTYLEQFPEIHNANSSTTSVIKPWKAKKADVVNHWKNLPSNLQINMQPVSKMHRGTRFKSDGLRITGSPQFINSVLSRIKDISSSEEKSDVRLDVEYRQIVSKFDKLNYSPSYVFYCHLVNKS